MLKELNLYRLDINLNKPVNNRGKFTKEVVEILGQNERIAVLNDDDFTKINISEGSEQQARTIDEISTIRSTSYSLNYLVIELYASRDDERLFVSTANEILSTYPEFEHFYVNLDSEVQELHP